MAQRRDSVEITRQKDVAPGDKTGKYYITLCNLPFGTSWQELKDFTRTVCEVDHVEVFRTSTSGWVRVNGRTNFDKAWQLLNGGHFNGRSIIASDRNKSHSIKVKELVDGSHDPTAMGQPVTQYGAPLSPPTLAACRQQEMSYLGAYPYAQLANYGDRPVMISEYKTAETTTAVDDIYIQRSPPGCLEAYSVPRDHHCVSWSSDAQFDAVGEPSHETTVEAAVRSDANEYFSAKRHQIVVTGFPRKTRSDEAASWIRRKMGQYASSVSRVDGPVNHSKTAYVTFSSPAILGPSLKALDNQTFQGNRVKANLPKERIHSRFDEPQNSTSNIKSLARQVSKSKASSAAPTSTKGSSSTKTKSSGSKRPNSSRKDGEIDRSRSVGGILIVDGSSGSSSKSEGASKSPC